MIGMLLGLGLGMVTSQPAILRPYNYLFNRLLPDAVPDPGTCVTLYRRGHIDRETYYNWLRIQGYDRATADLLYLTSEALLTADEIVEAFRRGLIDMQEAVRRLKLIGFSDADASLILNMGYRLYSVAEIITLYRRGFINENQFFEEMRKLGVTDAQAQALYNLTVRLLDAEAVITAYRRGYIDQEEYYERMKKIGFEREDADLMYNITLAYPGPSDWIRFAVRDVFNLAIVQKYGYDEEFPEAIVPHALKAGVTEEMLRWYWRAHWELPSPTQVYEMLHRLHPKVLQVLGEKYRKMGLDPTKLATDLDTAREMLKIADYPKFWRDRLVAISYAPLTRVDLRRIYKLGLISEEELKARLMELGYSEDDASLMVEFYNQYKLEEPKSLSKSLITKAYEDGLITRDEAKSMLKDVGYSEDNAELIIREVEVKVAEEIAKEREKTIKIQLLMGVIDEATAIGELSRIGIPQHRIERILWEVRQWKERRIRLPTKKDIREWVYYKIIDKEGARQWLKRLGYPDDAIQNFLTEWFGPETQPPAPPGGPGPGGPEQEGGEEW